MLKENVVFCGIGQGGSNITKELELNDCQCFYVNTSLDDLDTIDTSDDNKYHISGTKGMAKDVDFANTVIMNDYNDDKIVEAIYKKYANALIYFFVFTSAGGTGGGMGNQISRRFKERFPNKIVNVITAIPNDEEDMIMQSNSVKCLNGMIQNMEEGYVTGVQILDNNKKDYSKKMMINSEYASMLDKILSFQSEQKEGNLDEEELERLFRIPGVLTICELDNKDFTKDINEIEKTTIFAKTLKDVHTHGLILNEEQNNTVNRNLIRDIFGVATTTHDTVWKEDLNIIVSSGMTFDNSIIKDLKNNYIRLLNKKKEIEAQIKDQRDNSSDIDIDFSAVKSPIANQIGNTPTRTSRRGSVGARGETRYRK